MPRELLEQIHAPIGLDIGAVTPEEIAVSILAELIAVKHGKIRGRDASELSMQWNKLREPAKPGQRAGV
jgi:xanthine dehydrogenase accessory factor